MAKTRIIHHFLIGPVTIRPLKREDAVILKTKVALYLTIIYRNDLEAIALE